VRSRLNTAASQALKRAEGAEAALQRAVAAAEGGGGGGGAAEELAALQRQMEGWLEEMRVLKGQEEAAVAEAAAKAKLVVEVAAARDEALSSLAEAQKQVEELNAINSKLIGEGKAVRGLRGVQGPGGGRCRACDGCAGLLMCATLAGHTNSKQKVQHVVKMKEENNELHASLKKTQVPSRASVCPPVLCVCVCVCCVCVRHAQQRAAYPVSSPTFRMGRDVVGLVLSPPPHPHPHP
jgi:hypothetical protein